MVKKQPEPQVIVAKTLNCLPDFAELIAHHDRALPVWVQWAEGREILHDPIPNFYVVFSLTAVSVKPDQPADECVFLNLGHYKVTLQGTPIDSAEAKLVEDGARSAVEAVKGYLAACGITVRLGRPATVEGLKFTAGEAEFLRLDEGTGLYTFEPPAPPAKRRR